MKSFSSTSSVQGGKPVHARAKHDARAGILFVLPDVIGLAIFVVVPILFAFYYSFFDWNMVQTPKFAGLSNYVKLFGDEKWWASLWRTLVLALEYVPLVFVFSLILAAVVNYLPKHLGSFIKTSFLLPFSVTSVVAATLWMFLYSEKNGYLNSLLNMLGIPDQQFIGSTKQALVSIVVVMVWINLGYVAILFNSAIKNIPSEYYEAAQLDGASKIQQFFKITIPLIKRTSVFVLVTTTITAFQIMDIILVMTHGGPNESTQVGVLYIFDQSFGMLKMGYGSAMSVIIFLILLVISLIQMKLTQDKDED